MRKSCSTLLLFVMLFSISYEVYCSFKGIDIVGIYGIDDQNEENEDKEEAKPIKKRSLS